MSSIRIEEPPLFETPKPELPKSTENDYIEILLIFCIVVTTLRYFKQYLYNSSNKKNK